MAIYYLTKPITTTCRKQKENRHHDGRCPLNRMGSLERKIECIIKILQNDTVDKLKIDEPI